MVAQTSILVTLISLIDHIPMLEPPAERGRGRPPVSPDWLSLKALARLTPELRQVRRLLTEDGHLPSRRI